MPRKATHTARPPNLNRTWIAGVVCLSLVGLLTGCADTAGGGNIGAEGHAPPGFPVTVTNCGMTTTYQHPPQRVITVTAHAAELLFALGLQDRMVGTTFASTDEILPRYRDEYRRIPSLADKHASYEVLLKTAPGLIYAGSGDSFTPPEGNSRQRLGEAGIKTFLTPTDCAEGGAEGSVSLNDVREEIRTVAKIFGAGERAQRLIEQFNQQLTRVNSKLRGVKPASVFIYDSGTKIPFTAGGSSIANEVIRLAGGHNIFTDLKDDWADVSWEQVIQRHPRWILIMDYGSSTVQQKKQRLLSNPALAEVPAIKHKNFAVLPLNSVLPGVRAPTAVTDLAKQLHPGQFQ